MPGTATLFQKYHYSRPDFVGWHKPVPPSLPTQLQPGSNILEIGGRPIQLDVHVPQLSRPPSPDSTSRKKSADKQALAERRVLSGSTFPWPKASFDACVSTMYSNTWQYRPSTFAKVRRVLKVGGVYLFPDANIWHYVTLGSRLLPHAARLLLANRLCGLNPEAMTSTQPFTDAFSESIIDK